MYLAAFTFGLMQLVPTVLGARDRYQADMGEVSAEDDGEPNRVLDFLAFMLFVTGGVGLLSLRFTDRILVPLVVSVCIGAAVGVLHTEILRWIGRAQIDPELEPVDEL